jgi:hypothetical protein
MAKVLGHQKMVFAIYLKAHNFSDFCTGYHIFAKNLGKKKSQQA